MGALHPSGNGLWKSLGNSFDKVSNVNSRMTYYDIRVLDKCGCKSIYFLPRCCEFGLSTNGALASSLRTCMYKDKVRSLFSS